VVRILGFGESSVNLRAWVWALDSGKGFVMRTDLYKSIKNRFDKEGIEIPFPYRTVVFKKNTGNGKN
jgi:small-conductance mechanosensitive channel